MPTLTDTNITTWTADYQTLGGASANSPHTADLVGGLMAEQLQNIKSVVRAESENKQWERWALVATPVATPGTLSTRFSIPGNVLTAAVPPGPVALNRSVLVLGTFVAGPPRLSGYIRNIIATSPTIFDVQFYGGARVEITDTVTEMLFGSHIMGGAAPTGAGGAMPHFYQCGTATMANGTDHTDITFPYEEPDNAYLALATWRTYTATGSDAVSLLNIPVANRTTTGMRIAAIRGVPSISWVTPATPFVAATSGGAVTTALTGTVTASGQNQTHDQTLDWWIAR